jgi:sodium-dependent phosphate cotransporter
MDKSSSTAHLAEHYDNSSVSDKSSVKKVADASSGLEIVVVDGEKVMMSSLPDSGASSSDAKSIASSETGSEVIQKPYDPWDIIEQQDTGKKWSELTVPWKIWRVVWITVRLCLILGLLYVFVCSLDVLQDAFQLLSGRTAGSLFSSSLINNPVCGLMLGVLVTVLVQSSSTSTSISVSMVGSGMLGVKPAIPIIMGANIGTTVTNTLVALTQSPNRDEFRRAFAGATVHDMFNWLTVLILLPLECATGYLFYMTQAMTENIGGSSTTSESPQFLKVITEPLTKKIIMIDKKVITAIAAGSDRDKFPLAKYYCKEVLEEYAMNFTDGLNETAYNLVNEEMFAYNVDTHNYTDCVELTWTEVVQENSTKCSYLFVGTGLPGNLSEAAAGGILLAASLIALIGCLLCLVKILNSLLKGPMLTLVRRYINADFPGYASFLTGYAAMLIGAGITVLVQSSSVFTSALTPLVGIGIVTVERVYPLTLGSNIGTTITGILAALTADADMIRYTLQIAFCHLFFNITGIIIWYPIPFLRRVPLKCARILGNTTAKYRWFAIFYLITMFLLLPLTVFGLSMAGWYVLVAIGAPLLIFFFLVIVINVLQTRRPKWLPKKLRTWEFLPKPLHSLAPYDRALTVCLRSKAARKCGACCARVCRCCSCCQQDDDSTVSGDTRSRSSSDSGYEVKAVKGSKVVVVDDVRCNVESAEHERRTSVGELNKAYENAYDVVRDDEYVSSQL